MGVNPSFLGPDHICLAELLRREVETTWSLDAARRHCCDVFVLGYGEGPTRCGTKVGGLPYLSKSNQWPVSSRTGRPLAFVCQFRLAESIDLVGVLPGDVLLVFCDLTNGSEWHFEWSKLGSDTKDLVSIHDVPTGEHLDVPTCYGVRVRYFDYEEEFVAGAMYKTLMRRRRFRQMFSETDGEAIIEALAFVRAWACQLCVLKVGGIPYWANPIEALVKKSNLGRFIAMIPPINPPPVLSRKDKVYWMNGVNIHNDASLLWPPEGCIHLYLSDESSVEARFVSLEP